MSGLGVISNLGTMIGQLGNTGAVDLANFTEEYTYGSGLISGSNRAGQISYTKSDMTYVGTSDSDDLLNSTISRSNDKANVVSSSIGGGADTSDIVKDIYGALTEGDLSVIALLSKIYGLFSEVVDGDTVKVQMEKNTVDGIFDILNKGQSV